jgi:hypothetical protein
MLAFPANARISETVPPLSAAVFMDGEEAGESGWARRSKVSISS